MIAYSDIIQRIAIMAVPLLLAVVLHEVAHGWVAEKMGDPTARLMGRITINPLPHIDLWWTIILPLALIVSGSGLIFGGAKPVPINPFHFRNPRRGMMWVALSGPAANLALAALCAVLIHGIKYGAQVSPAFILIKIFVPVLYMLQVAVMINVVLAVFNLIPIPPLDGSRILMGLLPPGASEKIALLEPYGLFILIILLSMNVLHRVIDPVINLILSMLL